MRLEREPETVTPCHLMRAMRRPFRWTDPGVCEVELAIIAAALLAVAGVSCRLTDTAFTPAMAFVLIGLLVGPLVIDEVAVSPTSATVRTLAEMTLTIVLFADASRIKLRALRSEYGVPPGCSGSGCR